MAKNTRKPRTSQTQQILKFLQTGKVLTTEQARNRFGILKLSARISELRNSKTGKKYPIDTVTKTIRGKGEVTGYQLAA